MSPAERKKKREANLRPFQPGQSGNPKGRPKGARSFKSVIRDISELVAEKTVHNKEMIELLEKHLGHKPSNRELMIYAQSAKALAGDTRAFTALADREEGKPAQAKDVDTKETYLEFLDEVSIYASDDD